MKFPRSHNTFLKTPVLSERTARTLLGIPSPVPLTADAMARGLRVCFFPYGETTPRLQQFTARLQASLEKAGVQILSFEEARRHGKKGKLEEGIVIIAPGKLQAGKLPVDFVSNLRTATVVGVLDEPCPASSQQTSEQQKLNDIVKHLAWSIVQTVIFVEEKVWTICTMNGAVIPCPQPEEFDQDVLLTLVPKLAAPVVPPHASDFNYDEGGLDLRSPSFALYVEDFVKGAPLWARTGLMLFHTSLTSLTFRSTYYRRIAAAYLDKRSGMSYGFLARQLAVTLPKVLTVEEAKSRQLRQLQNGLAEEEGRLFVPVRLLGKELFIELPSVAVLSTRSGCDKAHIDGHRDLMLLQLDRGAVTLTTPSTEGGRIDYRPSYDTMTILAHALANALIGALLVHEATHARFAETLATTGMALAHWHGLMDLDELPEGYTMFGAANPPVSCSTHQAALFALMGKLDAFQEVLRTGDEFRGDIHIEPHHGINVTWPSLEDLALKLLKQNRYGSVAEASSMTGA